MISKECATCTRGTLQFCSTLKTTPNYPIIKNIFNQAYFDKLTSLKYTKENNLQSFIFIIQCNDVLCLKDSLGELVFSTQWIVVGMIVSNQRDLHI
jgi:hypothetical protein